MVTFPPILQGIHIGLDKGGYPVNNLLISPRKHMLWYSLEAPRRGASNEYPQHIFSLRNKKNINTFGLKKSGLTRAMATTFVTTLHMKSLNENRDSDFLTFMCSLFPRATFICVEILRPGQPYGGMSSAVSLPNHTFTGQA